jgi:hypothetical protein
MHQSNGPGLDDAKLRELEESLAQGRAPSVDTARVLLSQLREARRAHERLRAQLGDRGAAHFYTLAVVQRRAERREVSGPRQAARLVAREWAAALPAGGVLSLFEQGQDDPLVSWIRLASGELEEEGASEEGEHEPGLV